MASAAAAGGFGTAAGAEAEAHKTAAGSSMAGAGIAGVGPRISGLAHRSRGSRGVRGAGEAGFWGWGAGLRLGGVRRLVGVGEEEAWRRARGSTGPGQVRTTGEAARGSSAPAQRPTPSRVTAVDFFRSFLSSDCLAVAVSRFLSRAGLFACTRRPIGDAPAKIIYGPVARVAVQCLLTSVYATMWGLGPAGAEHYRWRTEPNMAWRQVCSEHACFPTRFPT